MKSTTLLPLAAAAAASAFVVPDIETFSQLPVHGVQPHDDASWKDWLPSADSIANSVHDSVDSLSSSIEDAISNVKGTFESELESLLDEEETYGMAGVDAADRPPHHHHGHGHGDPDLTIYQLISTSKYTTKFAKLVNEYDDIVQLLNSTSANYTLFVPDDEAFEHIPDKHKEPSKEFVEALLKYHIGLGLYPAGRVLVTHTLPTALNEPLLGGNPQRLRTSVGLTGVKVNFYSKVVAVDIAAKNGIIHAVRSILVPPPLVGRELSLFPGKFSTLLLAYDKTDFVSFIHNVPLNGSTVFAPDNAAFAKLGPAANAFLFNTETGLKYLKAILKYHIVANDTLYSDAYYPSADRNGGGEVGHGHYHLDLPTLLPEKHVAIDVARFAGFIRVKINGFIPIKLQDGVAKNGVVHVPAHVLIPPHKHGENTEQFGGEISVEELKERLADLIEDDDKSEVEKGSEKDAEFEL